MIVITGGAGFIGSNLVNAWNQRGRSDIVVVDNLKDGHKFFNLIDCDIADYFGKQEFLEKIQNDKRFESKIEVIFHQGACSATTEWDGRYMMENNYQYSKILLNYCIDRGIPLFYASSASVYGSGKNGFKEQRQSESPLNMYGYSKFLFDQWVRRHLGNAPIQIAGFRYFNVYGPREQHKGSMSSVAYHCRHQLLATGKMKLFEGCDGYGNGEQRRDFISVEDVVKVNLWFFDNPECSGIFNVGTGKSQPFNDVANAVKDFYQRGEIEYIDFPEHLKGHYQSFTEADIRALREIGYNHDFLTVEQGVARYMQWLEDQD